MSEFWIFGRNYNKTALQAHMDICIDDYQLIKGDFSQVIFPILFKQKYGKKLYDILGTGRNLNLVSDRFKKVLEDNYLTGWKTFPINLLDNKGKEIIGYHGFAITGRCKELSYEHSLIIEKQYINNGPICKFYKGATVIKWDGSDFFSPEKTFHTLITDKAAKILKKHKISNINIYKLSEDEVDIELLKNK